MWWEKVEGSSRGTVIDTLTHFIQRPNAATKAKLETWKTSARLCKPLLELKVGKIKKGAGKVGGENHATVGLCYKKSKDIGGKEVRGWFHLICGWISHWTQLGTLRMRMNLTFQHSIRWLCSNHTLLWRKGLHANSVVSIWGNESINCIRRRKYAMIIYWERTGFVY